VLLRKITFLGGNSRSFQDAQKTLAEVLEFEISSRHIETLTERVGDELAGERDNLARLWEEHRMPPPSTPNSPQAVAVAVDDGKLHTRAEDHPPGVHDPQWKNNKVACLMRVELRQHAVDPAPKPPSVFTDRSKVERLIAELGHVRSSPKQPSAVPPNKTSHASKRKKQKGKSKNDYAPNILVRSCVATHTQPDRFGAMVAAEAHMRRFSEAQEGAFLGDGSPGNWTIQELHFPLLLAILDFVHLIQHLYAAARAGTSKIDWKLYTRLLNAAWSGKPERVLRLLLSKSKELGTPPHPSDDDPGKIIADTIAYVHNNRARMQYPRARRLGLPITTSHVESLINTLNIRVKASGKFWCPSNVEAVLQVRAACESQTDAWNRFWHTRGTKHPGRIRPPRRHAA